MNGSNSDVFFYISRNNLFETYCLLNILLLYIIRYSFYQNRGVGNPCCIGPYLI